MRLYTSESQTAKLIELGCNEPKSIECCYDNGYDPDYAYSIGELIEMLPKDDVCHKAFEFDGFEWYVDWDTDGKLSQTSGVELIDALYYMVVKLKEEGVI